MNGAPGGGGPGSHGTGGPSGDGGTALGPPGAIFTPDQQTGDGQVTLTFTPA